MKTPVRVLVAGAAASLAACSATPGEAIRVATGAVSSFLCLGTFGSGERPDQVYADTFQPIPGTGLLDWALRYEVDPALRQVRATMLGGFESRAAYGEDQGCRMVHGDDGAESLSPAGSAVPPPPLLPAIAGPDVVTPADARLAAALAQAFAEPDQPPQRRTKAVVVVHRGHVIAERYAPGYGVDTPLLGNSITKSVVNALVGILVRDGRLAVGDRAPVPDWQQAGDPRRAITIDDLLRMRSGLELGNSLEATLGSLWNPSNRMLFLERDMAGFATRAALDGRPGTDWNYADGNTLILSRIVRDAVGGTGAAVRDFAQRELFDPLGMRHVTLGFDATGTPVGANHMLASARDWARLGMLYLGDGVLAGRRILPEGWVGYSVAPTPGAWAGYGAGFWTNQGNSFGARKRIGLGMPRDAFFGRGKFGQFVVVVPSSGLVIARFGTTHGEEDLDGVSRLVAAVTAALGNPSE